MLRESGPRDAGEAYAARLRAVGNWGVSVRHGGAIHDFFPTAGVMVEGRVLN